MGMTDILEILVAWDAGEGITAITRRLGYSRPTVRKYVVAARALGLRRGGQRRDETGWGQLAQAVIAHVAKQRAPGTASAAVAAHHAYLAARVGTLPVAVLYQRCQTECGVAASWGTFYRYVARHWPERCQPPTAATIRRDDPPPGEEAQVDFCLLGRWTDPATGRARKVYAFLMTLGHSRHQFLYPCLAEDSAAWLAGHVAAFAFFGGVPRRVVPDNLSAGISQPDRYDPRVNRAYGELARHYGCLIDPARVRHPRDKPKVERNVRYARASFFQGRDFASLAALRDEAARWCREVAGQRVHGTTGEQPLAAFAARERGALLPLPPQRWELATWTTALVGADCHLQAGGAAYSVPYRHVGQRLDVRLGAETVQIYAGAQLVTSHLRQPRGRVTKPDHYPEAGRAFVQQTPQRCLARARDTGPAIAALVQALLAEPTLSRLREVQALLRLLASYPAERVESACARATAAGDGRYRTVKGLLARDLDLAEPPEEPAPQAAGAYLRGPAAFLALGSGEEVPA
jgi:transposase